MGMNSCNNNSGESIFGECGRVNGIMVEGS